MSELTELLKWSLTGGFVRFLGFIIILWIITGGARWVFATVIAALVRK